MITPVALVTNDKRQFMGSETIIKIDHLLNTIDQLKYMESANDKLFPSHEFPMSLIEFTYNSRHNYRGPSGHGSFY